MRLLIPLWKSGFISISRCSSLNQAVLPQLPHILHFRLQVLPKLRSMCLNCMSGDKLYSSGQLVILSSYQVLLLCPKAASLCQHCVQLSGFSPFINAWRRSSISFQALSNVSPLCMLYLPPRNTQQGLISPLPLKVILTHGTLHVNMIFYVPTSNFSHVFMCTIMDTIINFLF